MPGQEAAGEVDAERQLDVRDDKIVKLRLLAASL